MKSVLFVSLSADVLLEIAGYLSRIDILHLSLVSSSIYAHVIGAAYRIVELQQADQCCNTLHMLSNRPEIARHVRKLTIQPDVVFKKRSKRNNRTEIDSHLVTQAIKTTAPRLDAMHTFIWAGKEYPPEDDMWLVLRESCPQLNYIGVTFGSVLPNIRSHLFEFDNLHGFALNFGSGFYQYLLFEISPETQPIFKRLWDMLINRCLDLRELSITTKGINSVDPVDAHRLCLGRWPRLRHLQLGNVTVDWQEPAPGDTTPFIKFLEDHEFLESLNLSDQFKILPENIAGLRMNSLPSLAHFTGSIDHLQVLPHTMSLKSIQIPQPLVVRELTATTISTAFQAATLLASLKITFILQSGYDSVNILRSIVSSCPHLRHLDLTCSHKPSISLEAFARNIRLLTKLQTFSLTIIKIPGDESMFEGAARIARTNPRLYEFSITYIQQDGVGDTKVSEKGHFELTCDGHGLPISLYTQRWKNNRIWGASSTSSCCDLRPLGHPGSGMARIGWVSLVLDNGQAGKDLRMLAVSFVLVLVTVWAVIC